MIDLHIHSNVTAPGDSGDSSPSDIIKKAKEIGLQAVALTDHDSVGGIQEAIKVANNVGLKFISGVEIACNFSDVEIEVVALGIDYKEMSKWLFKSDDQIIREKLDFINRSKEKCEQEGLIFPEIVLDTADLNIDELHEVVHKTFAVKQNRDKCAQITNIYPKTEQDYYKALFAPSRQCRVVKDTRTLNEAVSITHKSGGKAFLAHPKRADGSLASLTNEYIEETVKEGLDGIECINPKMMPKDSVALMDFCKERNLLMSGGTDSHAIDELEKWNKRIRVPDHFIGWFLP